MRVESVLLSLLVASVPSHAAEVFIASGNCERGCESSATIHALGFGPNGIFAYGEGSTSACSPEEDENGTPIPGQIIDATLSVLIAQVGYRRLPDQGSLAKGLNVFRRKCEVGKPVPDLLKLEEKAVRLSLEREKIRIPESELKLEKFPLRLGEDEWTVGVLVEVERDYEPDDDWIDVSRRRVILRSALQGLREVATAVTEDISMWFNVHGYVRDPKEGAITLITGMQHRIQHSNYYQNAHLIALPPKPFEAAPVGKPIKFHAIQVQSLQQPSEAALIVEKLRSSGLDAYRLSAKIPDKGTWHRVLIGQFRNVAIARKEAQRLKNEGKIKDFVIQELELPRAP